MYFMVIWKPRELSSYFCPNCCYEKWSSAETANKFSPFSEEKEKWIYSFFLYAYIKNSSLHKEVLYYKNWSQRNTECNISFIWSVFVMYSLWICISATTGFHSGYQQMNILHSLYKQMDSLHHRVVHGGTATLDTLASCIYFSVASE